MLDYINYNDTVLIGGSNEVDEYGIAVSGDTKSFSCYIRETEELEQITNKDGSITVLTAYVVVSGKCEASTKDYLILDGERKDIVSKKYIRDFDRNIIATKLGV